jgi:hypothetical protein
MDSSFEVTRVTSGSTGSSDSAVGFSLPKQRPAADMVIVYLHRDNFPLTGVLLQAKMTASRIFGGIGIAVLWQARPKHPSSTKAAAIIDMQLDDKVSGNFHPGAMAYATPFRSSGIRIHVFCDRVLKMASGEFAAPLLGHVMAHEIAHVLEGSNRHSAEGVMKGRWDSQDYQRMTRQTLRFDATDAALIQAALKRRVVR